MSVQHCVGKGVVGLCLGRGLIVESYTDIMRGRERGGLAWKKSASIQL